MRMRNKNSQQSRVAAIQPVDFWKILTSVLVSIQRQTKVNKKSLALAFNLHATSANLFATTMNAYTHDFPTLLLNL